MLEFYGAAAGVIPVFLLTLVLQTRTINMFASTRMELEETRIVFLELRAGRITDRQWLGDLGFLTPDDLRNPQLLDRKERLLTWTIRVVNFLTYAPVTSAFVALATSLGAIFAGGAPWPVSLLVWPGLVLPGLLLAMLISSSIGQKMAIATNAARHRLEENGLVQPRRPLTSSGGDIDTADRLLAAEGERRAFLRREMSKWISEDEDL